jgi:serine/threonine protein kinase
MPSSEEQSTPAHAGAGNAAADPASGFGEATPAGGAALAPGTVLTGVRAETVLRAMPADGSRLRRDHTTVISPPTPGTAAAVPPVGAAAPWDHGHGKYILNGELGRGGMAVVYLAADQDIHREVAVKMLHGADTDLRLRFLAEAQITGQLEHPNIVPVHDLDFDHQGRPFFSMKLVRGRSLAAVISGLVKGDAVMRREFPLPRLLDILFGVCNGIAYAHARTVVHRDLKPANIMIGDFGEVLVMDWGLAKVGIAQGRYGGSGDAPAPVATALAEREETRGNAALPAVPAGAAAPVTTTRIRVGGDSIAGTVAGTPNYMAPEQARGALEQIDARTDVFALGAILYELLTLTPPFSGRTVQDVLAAASDGRIAPPAERARETGREVPADLAAVAMKALEYRPENRYESAMAFRDDLMRWLDGRAVSARTAGSTERVWRFIRRHGATSAVAAAGLVVVVATVVGWGISMREEREHQDRDFRRQSAEAIAHEQVLRTDAEARKEHAEAAQHAAEGQAALAALGLAQWTVAAGRRAEAAAALERCPESQRGWEWARLKALSGGDPGATAVRAVHQGAVRALAFSADGAWLASGGDDGAVVLLSAGGERRLAGPTAAVRAVAFAPDAGRVAAADALGGVWVWAVAGSAPPVHGDSGDAALATLAFTADGRRVAAGGQGLHVWPVDGGEAVAVARDASWWLGTAGGARLRAVGAAGWLMVDGARGTVTAGAAPDPAARPAAVAATPDGGRLAVAVADGSGGAVIRLYDVLRASARAEMPVDAVPSALAWSPDGRRLAAAIPGAVLVASGDAGQELVRLPAEGPATTVMAFSPDGVRLVLGRVDGTVASWSK